MAQNNALLLIPSSAKRDLRDRHAGSMFQGRRTRGLVTAIRDPEKQVAKSRECSFPLDEKAHLPQDVLEAVQFIADSESNFSECFRGTR